MDQPCNRARPRGQLATTSSVGICGAFDHAVWIGEKPDPRKEQIAGAAVRLGAHSADMFVAKRQNNAVAAMLIVGASVFIAALSLLAKGLGTGSYGPPLHTSQISHGRFLFAEILISTVAAVLRPTRRAPNLGLHSVRTMCGWGGITLLFASVAFIPLGDATAISFLNPVFAMMLAIPLLGKKVGRIRCSDAGPA